MNKLIEVYFSKHFHPWLGYKMLDIYIFKRFLLNDKHILSVLCIFLGIMFTLPVRFQCLRYQSYVSHSKVHTERENHEIMKMLMMEEWEWCRWSFHNCAFRVYAMYVSWFWTDVKDTLQFPRFYLFYVYDMYNIASLPAATHHLKCKLQWNQSS